jgi:hypothetical protein
VSLSGGSWIRGERVRSATVRPITGADQASLGERGTRLPASERASAILRLCVRIDEADDAADAVRRLSVGDREALLLHIHRITFGDPLRCVVTCPHDECGERMDLELDASSLIVPPYEEAREWYDLAAETGRPWLRFRIPTGLDQEAIVSSQPADADSAALSLALRCVDFDAPGADPAAGLDDAAVSHVAEAMLDRDPQAEIMIDTTCPACGRTVDTLFDAGAFVYEELVAAVPRLYREVHTLALRYHWSEADILSLTQPQRKRYLDLLGESGGDGDGVA